MVIFSKIERLNCFLLFLGGMFHVIFFKEMEKVWSRRPAFALARQCPLAASQTQHTSDPCDRHGQLLVAQVETVYRHPPTSVPPAV